MILKGTGRAMKCWIIYNGFLQSEKFIDFARMLQDAAVHFGHEAHIFKNSDILNEITTPVRLIEEKPDYVLFTDKDIYLARYLEAQGIAVYNSADTIETSDDKIKTYQQLAYAGIPVPKTIVLPKTYGLSLSLDNHFMEEAIQSLGLPLVVKEAFGSFGEQVYLAETTAQLEKLILLHGHKPLMLQQFITTSYGRDIRIQIVGNRAVTAMKRTSAHDFRANITTGGKMFAYEPNEQEIDIAVASSNAIGAQFSGVDLLFGPSGSPIVCEVNANAHIRNLLDCTGVNAAKEIIRYIDQLSHTGGLS